MPPGETRQCDAVARASGVNNTRERDVIAGPAGHWRMRHPMVRGRYGVPLRDTYTAHRL